MFDSVKRLFELRKVEPIELPDDVDLNDPTAVREWLRQKAQET